MHHWTRVTWYSRLATIVVFLGLIPVLAFYLGMQYEMTVALFSDYTVQTPPVQNTYLHAPFMPATTYSFKEPDASGAVTTYRLTMNERNGDAKYVGTLAIDAPDTSLVLDTTETMQEDDSIVVSFDGWDAPSVTMGTQRFTIGDVLFILHPLATGYAIEWRSLQPRVGTTTSWSVFAPVQQ